MTRFMVDYLSLDTCMEEHVMNVIVIVVKLTFYDCLLKVRYDHNHSSRLVST